MFQMETGCLCRYFHPSIHPFSAAYPIHELRGAKTYSSCQEAKVVVVNMYHFIFYHYYLTLCTHCIEQTHISLISIPHFGKLKQFPLFT